MMTRVAAKRSDKILTDSETFKTGSRSALQSSTGKSFCRTSRIQPKHFQCFSTRLQLSKIVFCLSLGIRSPYILAPWFGSSAKEPGETHPSVQDPLKSTPHVFEFQLVLAGAVRLSALTRFVGRRIDLVNSGRIILPVSLVSSNSPQ